MAKIAGTYAPLIKKFKAVVFNCMTKPFVTNDKKNGFNSAIFVIIRIMQNIAYHISIIYLILFYDFYDIKKYKSINIISIYKEGNSGESSINVVMLSGLS